MTVYINNQDFCLALVFAPMTHSFVCHLSIQIIFIDNSIIYSTGVIDMCEKYFDVWNDKLLFR